MSADQVTVSNQEDLYPEEAYRELIEVGVFYGRDKSKANPKMKQYILTNRGGIEIINLAKTLEGLDQATGFIKEKIGSGSLLLLVGTQPSAQADVLRLALKFGLPYVVRRWLGGTLTNFKVITKRVEYFKKMKSDFAAGAFQKYTKKEQLEFEREIRRLEELMGGLQTLPREPNLMLVVDPQVHLTAVREAKRLKIPVVAFADVDANPDLVDYLVPGNTKSRKSVEWFLDRVEAAIEEGKTMQKIEPPPEPKTDEKPAN